MERRGNNTNNAHQCVEIFLNPFFDASTLMGEKIVQLANASETTLGAHKGRVTIREMNRARMKFYNPYPTLEEYERRKERFVEAQSHLLEPVGVMPEDVVKMEHNLNNAGMTGLFYFFGAKQALENYVAGSIFGELFVERAELQLYRKDDKSVEETLKRGEYLYEPGKLFFFRGYVIDENSEMLGARKLHKSALTQEEVQECSLRAKEMYDVFEFSQVHYAKMHQHNFLDHFLDQIVEIGALLDLGNFPQRVHTGEVRSYFKGNEYLAAGYFVDGTHDEKSACTLINVFPGTHPGLLSPGTKVRYMTHASLDHDIFAKLLDVLP